MPQPTIIEVGLYDVMLEDGFAFQSRKLLERTKFLYEIYDQLGRAA